MSLASRTPGLLAFLLVVSCAGPAPKPPPSPIGGAQCLNTLIERGIRFTPVADFHNGHGCGITDAVSVARSSAALSRPARMSCPLAMTLHDFEIKVVQPLAFELFGQPVVRLHHYGTYVCRSMRRNAGRLSEHAHGRAIDISAFELADGTLLRIDRHWRTGDRRSLFLRRAAAGACSLFSVVLTPNSDADHQDHFHLDIGRWRHCGV